MKKAEKELSAITGAIAMNKDDATARALLNLLAIPARIIREKVNLSPGETNVSGVSTHAVKARLYDYGLMNKYFKERGYRESAEQAATSIAKLNGVLSRIALQGLMNRSVLHETDQVMKVCEECVEYSKRLPARAILFPIPYSHVIIIHKYVRPNDAQLENLAHVQNL